MQSLLQVDDELDAEELHPQLHDSEQHDDGMGPPGFPGNPNRSLGMAAAQYMQQYQDVRSVRRGKRAGEVARM